MNPTFPFFLFLILLAIHPHLKSFAGTTGTVDESFVTGSGFDWFVNALAIQSDGKILAGGLFSNYKNSPAPKIARLLPNGDLDHTFQPGTGPNTEVNFLFVQPDDKILIGGNFSSYNGTSQRLVARLLPTGELDTNYLALLPSAQLLAADLQTDGKLIIGGTFSTVNGQPYRYIARLNADGSLDESFNPGLYIRSWPQALKLQPDGKLLVAGGLSYESGSLSREYLFRLNPDGSLDESFDSHGVIFASNLLQHLPDGSILGEWIDGKRLFPDGTYDSRFFIPDPFPNRFFPLPDGRILGHSDLGTPTLFFADGSPQMELPITIGGIDAIAPGPNGTFYLAGDFSQVNGQPVEGITRIFFHDLSAPAQVNWNGTNFTALEAHQTTAIPIFRSGETNSEIHLNLRTIAGVAETPSDFQSSKIEVTFLPGELVKYLAIPLVDDSLPEPDEQFSLVLSPQSDPVEQTAIIHIISNEGFIEFDRAQDQADELGNRVSLNVRKIGAIPYQVITQVLLDNTTLDPNLDLSLFLPPNLVVDYGDLSRSLSIPIYDDRLAEGAESLDLLLAPPLGSHALGLTTSYHLTVIDNDLPGRPAEGLDAPSILLATADGGVLGFGTFRTVHGFPKPFSAKLDHAGQLQTNFTAYRPAQPAFPIRSLPDGKSLYSLLYSNSFSNVRYGFMRLNADGTRDTSYSTNLTFLNVFDFKAYSNSEIFFADPTNLSGRVGANLRLLGPSGQLQLTSSRRVYFRPTSNNLRVGRQSTGHLLVAGDLYGSTNTLFTVSESSAYAKDILRFNPDGTPDFTFSRATISPVGSIRVLEILPDDRILLGGAFTSINGVSMTSLARLLPNGELDTAFQVDFSFLGTNKFSFSQILPLHDGTILLRLKTDSGETLLRLKENGEIDPQFTPRSLPPNTVTSLVQLTDGKIALSGNFLSFDGQYRGRLVWLTPTGELLPADPLIIDSIARSESSIQLIISSRVTGNFLLQSSTDLRNWQTLQTIPLTPGTQSVTIPLSEDQHLFFKLTESSGL